MPDPAALATAAPALPAPAARHAVPVVASDWLRPRLGRTWRTGVVVGVGPRAAYVGITGSSSLLALEAHDAVGLPNGLVLPAGVDVLAGLRAGDAVRVDHAGLRAGPWRLAVRRWHRSRPTLPRPARDLVARRLAALAGTTAATPGWLVVPSGWPRPDPRLLAGLADLGAIVGGVLHDPVAVAARLDRLLGYGPGSTPSGDDLVAGFVATWCTLAPDRRPAVAPIVDHVAPVAASRTTALSSTLLAAAFDGAMARPAAAVVAALAAADDAAASGRLRDRVEALGRVGHSSGRDLALGVLGAAALVVADDGAPPALPRPPVPARRSA